MSLFSCLHTAIGLTRKEPNCVSGYEADFTTSQSNLFLDELKGLDLKRFDELGGETDVWEKMSDARQNAIIALKADLSQELSKYLEIARKPFSGDIGSTRFAGTQTSRTLKGMKIFSNVNGGSIRIRGFNIMLDSTEAIELKIYKVYDKNESEELYSLNLTSQANRVKYNALPSPIELDLDGEYYFVYESVGKALKSKYGCCGFKWCYNTDKPCYSPSKMQWTKWLMAAGTTGTDINQPQNFSTSMYSYGITLTVDTLCDAYAMLCNDGTDFENDPVAVSTAFAILYKSGEFMLDYVLDSNEVNRYTLLSKETIDVNRQYYTERYAACIEYVASELNHRHNDCWSCKDKATMRRQML